MEAIFEIIITTSIYASVVGLIIILMKRILTNRLNPKWHFLIWTVLIIKLLVPFGPESAFSLFNAVPRVTDQPPVTLTSEQIYRAIMPSEFSQPQYSLTPSPGIETEGQQWSGFISEARQVLPYIWFFGAIGLTLWLLYTNFSLHRRLKKSRREVPESIYVILEECKQRMGINKKIEIIVQDTIATPSIFGLVTPKILITPQSLELNNKELSYILLHELAHYKRRDLLTNYLLLGLQIMHWFNPVIWYCFRIIRRDMEIAADDRVLSVLQRGEEKEYGKALLTVLESFSTPRFLPKLIGMVDDKKNIKKRIHMIKTAEIFQKKRIVFFLTGMVCVILLSAFLLTNPLTNKSPNEIGNTKKYHTETLLQYKNPYVGDASNVSNLLHQLPYADYRQGISLQTGKEPYGITTKYDFSTSGVNLDQVETELYNNALVMFALIDNVDLIAFDIRMANGERKFQFSREQMQQNYINDLREYAKDKSNFEILLNSIELKLVVNPPKYTPAMSSTPGIHISPQYKEYEVTADEVHYSTLSGSFIGWHSSSGKVIYLGSNIELSYDSPIYWSPGERGSYEREPDNPRSIPVHISVNRNGKIVAEKQLTIQYDGVGFYTVEPTHDVLVGQSIDEAISQAVKNQGQYYRAGEVATEGHILLDTEEKDGVITAYTIASFAYFGFENGIFTTISGGAMPTVITFKRDQQGMYPRYSMLSYKEPMDGAGNLDSVKKMFPEHLWPDVLPGGNRYPQLRQQQEAQAQEYLKSIGRNATVSSSHVEKKLLNLSSVPASNKLFSELTKFDTFLNSCPYWIGSRETIENGERYIYETNQSKTDDGYDLVIFSKRQEDGTVVQEAHYKVVGDDPQLVHYSS